MQKNAVYSKNPFWKIFSWYESLGDINCSKPASLVTYNGKKYVVKHVKDYDNIGYYHNPTYFCESNKPKDYNSVIRKRNFQLTIKKIICIVTFGLIRKLGEYFRKNVTFLGNETAIKKIMSAVINEEFAKKDKVVGKLWDEVIEANDNLVEGDSNVVGSPAQKTWLARCDEKRKIYWAKKEEFEITWCEKIKKMNSLELVKFLKSEESKKFFAVKRLKVSSSRFYSKEVPQIINEFKNLKDLMLHAHIIPRMQKNAFCGLKNLIALDISHADTLEIEDGTFNSLNKLESLEFETNSYINLTISEELKREIESFKNLSYYKIKEFSKTIFSIDKKA